MAAKGAQNGRVERRKVFYIPGYDPFGPRRYRELYRAQSAAQAAISGYEIGQEARHGGAYGWRVRSVQDGSAVETDIEIMLWSDIVQSSMASSIAATYGQLLRTAWIYIATGALWRLLQMRKGPVIAALYPVVMLLGQLVLALALGWGAGRLAGWGAQQIWPVAQWPVHLAAMVLVLGAVLRAFKRHDNRIYAYYLMHDFAFSAAGRGRMSAPMRRRIQEFRTRIETALHSDVDEVLVVGHSSGAHIGVSVLADLLRGGAGGGGGATLSFLSLGQVVPMVSFLPQAAELRRDLAFLSLRGDLAWVDVTAPGDGCAFALCDPVAVSGVAPEGQKWPLVISAAFSQTLSPARWAELKRRFFRLHFQYLCAFDRPGDYDYFRITAGPLTLGARFAGRAPSRSRITRALSRYRSVAP